MGFVVRTESLGGALGLMRSMDLVSILRRLGALGRRGGSGRLNPIDEGGGEGDESSKCDFPLVSLLDPFALAALFEEVETLLELLFPLMVDVIMGIGLTGIGDGGLEGLEEVDETGSISGSFLERNALAVSNWKRPEPFLAGPAPW